MFWNNKNSRPILFLIILTFMWVLISSCSYFTNGKNTNSSSAISNIPPTATTEPRLTPTTTPTPTITPTLTPTPAPTPTLTPVRIIKSVLKIGDYILMGKYYDEPILWRCIDIDKNGPLMLSDRILMIKAFDAGGIHKYADGTLQKDFYQARTKYGSNLWDTSNLRTWLNSTTSAGKIIWPDGCPPIHTKLRDDVLYEYADEYANEKGFISTGNFTLNERKILKSVTQKVMINGDDEAKLTDGGSEHFNFEGFDARDRSLADAVQNYDNAYYHNVTDKVFILDVKQMYDLSLKTTLLGKNYHIGKPTKKMIENSKYTSKGFLSSDNYWCNWLRTPFPNRLSTSWVLIAGSPGISSPDPLLRITGPGDMTGSSGVFTDSANDFYVGVRPAFYINLVPGIFTDGYGTLASPYMVRK